MQSVKDIKNRIKSVSETAQITRAMELISASKMQKAAARYNGGKAYFELIRPIVFDVAKNTDFSEPHPYLTEREGKRVFLVLGSDKGMSGDYNHAVATYTLEQTQEGDDVLCVGAAVGALLVSSGREITMVPCSQDGKLEDARMIAFSLMEGFDSGKYAEINVLYTSVVSKVKQTCERLKLLPILPPEKTETTGYVFEPDVKKAFEDVVFQYVVGEIYECIASAKYSEHLERMRAMNAATDSANALLDELKLNYNKARQEKITTELTELSSGLIDP